MQPAVITTRMVPRPPCHRGTSGQVLLLLQNPGFFLSHSARTRRLVPLVGGLRITTVLLAEKQSSGRSKLR